MDRLGRVAMAGLSSICGTGDLVAALWLKIARWPAMPAVGAFGAVRFQAGSAGEQLSWVWVDAGFSLGVGQPRLDAPYFRQEGSPGAFCAHSVGILNPDRQSWHIAAVDYSLSLLLSTPHEAVHASIKLSRQ